jgi:hypothetical protein
MKKKNPITDSEIKNLVMERLKAFPAGKRLLVGSGNQSLDKEDLIKHVKKESKIGQKVIDIQLNYLRSFKKGTFHR